MSRKFTFSSESVGEGHPDKVADAISDAILDACLTQDPESRVACETLVKSDCVVLAGEITTSNPKPNYEKIVRDTIESIGYTYSDHAFKADTVNIKLHLTEQAPDIAQGVDERQAEGKEDAQQGAGDQGIMFGFACNETPELMPAPIMFAHRLTRALAEARRANQAEWLRPDCKSQVAVDYEDNKPKRIASVVISTQHSPNTPKAEIEKFCKEKIIHRQLPAELIDKDKDKGTQYHINPTGDFAIGGPVADAGLTGRKIIVDTYGGYSRHGGGAFSGKDPSKVDRSAAYMCRWVAKNIVAAKLADCVELQIGYAIGKAEPTSIYLNTFGSGKLPDDKLIAIVKDHFDFRPAAIIKRLKLKRPIYGKTTHYGHFGKGELPWEQTDMAETLSKHLCT